MLLFIEHASKANIIFILNSSFDRNVPKSYQPIMHNVFILQNEKKGIVAALNLAAMGFKAQMQQISHENIKIITLLTNPNRKKLEYIGVGKSADWK